MSTVRQQRFRQWLALAAVVVVVKVTLETIWGYRFYLPPDFQSDFLSGRKSYFFGTYRRAFYLHILSGPVALLLGTVLLSDRFRSRWPAWHRRLGRVHVLNTIGIVAPSGLWMGFYAAAGPVGAASFVTLALLTAGTAALGWRAALQRSYSDHRRWMLRCYLLLSSAVVIRLLGGFATLWQITAIWWDPVASWACWIVPLLAFEVWTRRKLARFPGRETQKASG